MVKDSPWVFHNQRPEVKAADKRIPVNRPQVGPGTRIKQRDPQHRTKGTKNGVKIRISQGNQFARPDAVKENKRRSPSKERARLRRHMKRHPGLYGL